MIVRHTVQRAISALGVISLAAASLVAAPSVASAAGPFVQTSPLTQSTTTDASAAFVSSPITFDNTAVAPVTFIPIASSPPGLNIDSTGVITHSGALAAGSYSFSGTATDSSLVPNTGSWSYTLNVSAVTLNQTSATSASTTPAASATFPIGPLSVSNAVGTVTYAATVPNANLNVSSSGAISTIGTLPVGSYAVSGTATDSLLNTGNWAYTLNVNAVTLNQTSQTNAATATTTSSTFVTAPISVSGAAGAVTFVTTSPSSGLNVTSGGVISTAGTLGFGSYTVSGTDSDAFGDSGTWIFTLNVNAVTSAALNQTSPVSGTTTSAASATLAIAPITVSNAIGSVIFVTTSPSTGLKVSTQGKITTTGTLASGVYTVFGTDSDGSGESGTWTYTLTVSSAGVAVTFNANGGAGAMTAQSANAATALTTNTFTRSGYSFAGWNTAANGSGTAYVNGATYPFSAPTTLYAQWTAAPNHTVLFKANGGKGSMGVEHRSTPGRLSQNRFTRAGYSFAGWNTAANGSRTGYANGATYAFKTSTTLYAQWSGAATHSVTFNANGGAGLMGRQRHHGATNLARNRFTRTGSVFTGWNSAANGAGTAYANGASYAFSASTTLFAQWRAKVVNTVTFNANGGKGAVGPQSSPQPTKLAPNGFTRTGSVFTGWNSAANGSGTAYANGASYAFSASTTLFAQWRAVKKPVKPAIHAVVTLNSFNVNSYALSTSLQAQVASLAKLIKANRDTQIALVGYGDTLTKADQLNELKWAAELKLSKQRAIAVEAYLTQQLPTLGVHGFNISVIGQGATNPGTSGAADAKSRRVVATIT